MSPPRTPAPNLGPLWGASPQGEGEYWFPDRGLVALVGVDLAGSDLLEVDPLDHRQALEETAQAIER